MQKAGNRNTDGRQDLHRFLILGHRRLADIIGPQGTEMVDNPHDSVAGPLFFAQRYCLFDKILPIDEPYFTEHDHAIGGEYDAEGRNCRSEMRGEHRLHGPQRLLQMHKQRHGGDRQQGQ